MSGKKEYGHRENRAKRRFNPHSQASNGGVSFTIVSGMHPCLTSPAGANRFRRFFVATAFVKRIGPARLLFRATLQEC